MKNKIILQIFFLFTLLFILFSCSEEEQNNENINYEVTFEIDNEIVDKVTVKNNHKVKRPEDPVIEDTSDMSYRFLYWYLVGGDGTPWSFENNVVTGNITLTALFNVIDSNINELKMTEEPLSNTICWYQNKLSTYEIRYKVGNQNKTIYGQYEFDEEKLMVTFTPDDILQGGMYEITVKDTKKLNSKATENLMFHGIGTKDNPYLITSQLDFQAVNGKNVSYEEYYLLNNDITVNTDINSVQKYVFEGNLDGNGHTITIDSSNCGLFHYVGQNATITTLYLSGNLYTMQNDSVGALADYNDGDIEKIFSSVCVQTEAGRVGIAGLEDTLNTNASTGSRGIAGGIVGTNLKNGIIDNCFVSSSSVNEGIIKVNICGGLIAGYNQGLISNSSSNGCVGAWNNTEIGNNSVGYSFIGGICGINSGRVIGCEINGQGRVMAQRYDKEVDEDITNSYIGGIVGYNMNGTVNECGFYGLRVHGDLNVGGIAGGNTGTVKNCIFEGNPYVLERRMILAYVGGRANVGGIVGLNENGFVRNCINTGNVYAYQEKGYSIASKASNSLYIDQNPTDNSLVNNPKFTPLILLEGNNNQVVEYGKKTVNYEQKIAIDPMYLSVVNSENSFKYNGLCFSLIKKDEEEVTLKAELYVGNHLYENVVIGETPKTLPYQIRDDYRFIGYSLEADSKEIYIKNNQLVTIYNLEDKLLEDKLVLYAVYEKINLDNNVLNIMIWDRYVGEKNQNGYSQEQGNAIVANLKNYLNENITYNIYRSSNDNAASFGQEVISLNDVDIIIGSEQYTALSSYLSIILSDNLKYNIETGTKNRQAALMTTKRNALRAYGWLTGNEYKEISVVIHGDSDEVTILNNMVPRTLSVPLVTVSEGKEVIGFTAKSSGSVFQLGDLNYNLLREYVINNMVDIYPVVQNKPLALVRVVGTTTELTRLYDVNDTIKLPSFVIESGYQLAGFVINQNSETPDITKTTSLKYSDIAPLLDENNELTLYPFFKIIEEE